MGLDAGASNRRPAHDKETSMSSTRLPRQYRSLFGFAIAALLLLGSASIANAQYYGAPPPRGYGGYPPPPPPPAPMNAYRHGLTLGAGIGIGGISAADTCGNVCGVAGAFEFHIGVMLNPRLAILFDFWANNHFIPNTDASTTHSIYTGALQYWVADKIWLKGGIGGANMNISSDYDGFIYDRANGLGIMGAGGFEVLQMYNFALDLQLRLGHGFYDPYGDVNSWALMIGANWY
jgi:hypothetical protein